MDLLTSCTKDQAVAILLGWSDKPIRYRPTSEYPTQEELDNIPIFDLQEEIEDRLEEVSDEYAEAKYDGKPACDLKRLQSAKNEFKKQIVLAHTYLCDIADELAKGDASALRVEPQSSESITLASLKAWALKKYNRDILPGILIIEPSQASKNNPAKKPRPRLKLRDQEDAILDEIRRLGHDPESLPKNQSGKPGIKKEVRDALNGNSLFDAMTAFDKAWERLQKQK